MSLPPCNYPGVRTGFDPLRPKAASRTPLWLATTLSAALLAACGGGGGGDGTQTVGASVDDGGDMSQFESVISADPTVRQIVVSKALSPKADSSDGSDRSSSDEASDDDDSSGDDSESDDDSQSDDGEDGSSSADRSSILDTLVSDMSDMNDHPLKDVNRKYGFSRGPGYNLAGVNSGGWNYVLPWFVTFEGEGNRARNTRIEMRNLRMFIKTNDGEWKRLVDVDTYEGIECEQHGNYYQCPQVARVRDEGDSASSKPIPNLNMHGWWDSRVRIDGHDVAAMIFSLEARLIVDDQNRGDDRGDAKYLVHVGADYYPSDAPPSGRLTPVGVSRAKLVTSDWQTFSFTTLTDVGKQEPGSGISESELRKNPPPL